MKVAHAEVIAKFRQLETQRAELESSAKKLNKARKEAWAKASERYQHEVTQYREKFEKERDSDLDPLRQARVLIENNKPEGVVRHFDLALRRLVLPHLFHESG